MDWPEFIQSALSGFNYDLNQAEESSVDWQQCLEKILEAKKLEDDQEIHDLKFKNGKFIDQRNQFIILKTYYNIICLYP